MPIHNRCWRNHKLILSLHDMRDVPITSTIHNSCHTRYANTAVAHASVHFASSHPQHPPRRACGTSANKHKTIPWSHVHCHILCMFTRHTWFIICVVFKRCLVVFGRCTHIHVGCGCSVQMTFVRARCRGQSVRRHVYLDLSTFQKRAFRGHQRLRT